MLKSSRGGIRWFTRWLWPRPTGVMDLHKCECLLLANGSNASVSYFVEPWLDAQGRYAALVDTRRQAPSEIPYPACRTVVIVRYLPPEWTGPIERFRHAGGKVVYFMDDDLMDRQATAGLPPDYARRIDAHAIQQRRFIETHCEEFWVSSSYLADKYHAWHPRVLPARPGRSARSLGSSVSVCYHGSASHQAELDWLVEVVGRVMERSPQVRFEVIGNHATNRQYRDLPRVSVLHPMSWQNYQAYTAAVRHDIALAPLLPGPFNAGRGPTKFFDATRMGAVGVYTDIAPYRGFVRPDVDGLLLPNEVECWVETILSLEADLACRKRMARAAQDRVQALSAGPSGPASTPDMHWEKTE